MFVFSKTKGSEIYLDSPCPSGHYCPEGTATPYEYPCPAKTYFNLTQARDVADCLPCPGGEYCEKDGLTTPTGPCQAGQKLYMYTGVFNTFFNTLALPWPGKQMDKQNQVSMVK